MTPTISLTLRAYRATPTSAPPGIIDTPTDLPLAATGFIELHCWDVGCPGGQPVPDDYWVFMGFPETHAAAWEIVRDRIAPALNAARTAGMRVFHVQPESIAAKYPAHRVAAPEAPALSSPSCEPPSEALPGFASARAEAVHGAGFMAWDGWPLLDIAEPVRPIGGEPVIVTTAELDALCRARGIVNLIYTGFAANLCILDSPAAMKAMLALGYRCILLRDATLAVEFPDTLDRRLHTGAALRYVETWAGYTAATDDFLAACARLADAEAGGRPCSA
jgi:nicotinamidase-related amidase